MEEEGPGLESPGVEECAIFSVEALSVQGRFLDSELVNGTLPPESEAVEVADGPVDVLLEVADELEVVAVA